MSKLKCLICGKSFHRVATHTRQAHGVSAREYKEMFGLAFKKGLCSPESAAATRESGASATLLDGSQGVNTRLKKGNKLRYKRGYSKKFEDGYRGNVQKTD